MMNSIIYSRITNNTSIITSPGGYSWEFLVGVFRPVLYILTLFHTKIRLLTVLYFSRKIIEIERFVLRAAILHERQNYLGDGAGLGGAMIPDAHPLGTFENQDTGEGKTRYISRKNRGL